MATTSFYSNREQFSSRTPLDLLNPEIAARLGMGMANAHRRIKRLKERG